MISTLIRKHSSALTLIAILLCAYAAPYLVPGSPDASVFRSGTLSFLLFLAAAFPVKRAFETHSLRALRYGGIFALILSFFLGLGSELLYYDGFLPGLGSMLRRFAVPCMATPVLGALGSYFFAHSPKVRGASRIQFPYWVFFLIFAISYSATLLAFFPGIINYDFSNEITQYITGEYLGSHPVFHTLLTGVLYQLGTTLFGSVTVGAALYSVVQLLSLSAMYAWCCCFVQKRVPFWAVSLLTIAMAILPFHGVIAISTVKDAYFTGLCAMLCLTLWEAVESPATFFERKKLIRLFLIALFMCLFRHNAVFAVIPAMICVLLLSRKLLFRAAIFCGVTLLFCFATPQLLETATDAKSLYSSELMSVPCQQLMRTAAKVDDLTEEEYEEIAVWFSHAISRYRPSYADPAKGGNFDLARYSAHPEEYWRLYLKYAKRYPRIYVEAFFANCMGIWFMDDTTHAHTMDSEEYQYVYLKTGNIVPEILGEVDAHSYLPAYKNWIRSSTNASKHENTPLYSQFFKPATYVYLLLLLTMLAFYQRRSKFVLCALPVWGITISLLFSACILVRYAYPLMVTVPFLLLLMFFTPVEQ